MTQHDPEPGPAHPLTPLVDVLLAGEPLPVDPVCAQPLPIPDGETALDRAFAGLYLAVNTVSAADHDGRVRERGQRRDRLLDWRQHLGEHPLPEGPVGGAILRGGDDRGPSVDGKWSVGADAR